VKRMRFASIDRIDFHVCPLALDDNSSDIANDGADLEIRPTDQVFGRYVGWTS
jgi:hypothetical protein